MAKPARVKKKQEASASKKSDKAGARRKAKEASAKPKAKAAAAKARTGGLRGRVASAQQKSAKPAKGAAKAPRERKAFKFFREVKVELSKVTWPTREELIQSTIVVVVAVLIAGIFIEIFDLIFSKLVSAL